MNLLLGLLRVFIFYFSLKFQPYLCLRNTDNIQFSEAYNSKHNYKWFIKCRNNLIRYESNSIRNTNVAIKSPEISNSYPPDSWLIFNCVG